MEYVNKMILVFYMETRAVIKIPKSQWIFLVLIIGCWFISTQYEVQTTSLVTIREKPKPFQTIQELFRHGFKVYDIGDCLNITEDYACIGDHSSIELDWNFVKRKALREFQGRWIYWYLHLENNLNSHFVRNVLVQLLSGKRLFNCFF